MGVRASPVSVGVHWPFMIHGQIMKSARPPSDANNLEHKQNAASATTLFRSVSVVIQAGHERMALSTKMLAGYCTVSLLAVDDAGRYQG